VSPIREVIFSSFTDAVYEILRGRLALAAVHQTADA
jgi:hypothetical protein